MEFPRKKLGVSSEEAKSSLGGNWLFPRRELLASSEDVGCYNPSLLTYTSVYQENVVKGSFRVSALGE